MKEYGGVDVYIHIFLTLALVGGEWPASCPSPFTAGERAPCTHWIGGWVGPRAGLENMEKILDLLGLELRPLGSPAHSQSLYRLMINNNNNNNNTNNNNVAYLLHARTVEPQKQPFLSNTCTQQSNNGVTQPASKQRLIKHTSAKAQ
jgi:hypothetical protein